MEGQSSTRSELAQLLSNRSNVVTERGFTSYFYRHFCLDISTFLVVFTFVKKKKKKSMLCNWCSDVGNHGLKPAKLFSALNPSLCGRTWPLWEQFLDRIMLKQHPWELVTKQQRMGALLWSERSSQSQRSDWSKKAVELQKNSFLHIVSLTLNVFVSSIIHLSK